MGKLPWRRTAVPNDGKANPQAQRGSTAVLCCVRIPGTSRRFRGPHGSAPIKRVISMRRVSEPRFLLSSWCVLLVRHAEHTILRAELTGVPVGYAIQHTDPVSVAGR